MATNAKTKVPAGITPVIHVSQPNKATGKGGGVEYVEFSGPEVTGFLMKNGIGALLSNYGLGHVQPWDIYLSNGGYGDSRTITVRIKRDVAEGKRPVVPTQKEAPAKQVWSPTKRAG
jgi:hypothetical protein